MATRKRTPKKAAAPVNNQPTEPTTEPAPPEQAPTKKLSANEFVGRHLIAHPEATEDDVKTALAEAEMKLNEYAIHAWVKDWKWMVPALEEAGWKRP